MNSRIFADKAMIFLKKYNTYSKKDEMLAHYGLETIYILITKTIFITILSILFGILKEVYLFIIFFGLLRLYSSGMHMKKGIHCTIISTICLLGFPYLSINTSFKYGVKLIIIGISIICFTLYSPADTYKKPLINVKKRKILKIKSIIVLFIYAILTLYIRNSFISSIIIYSIILQVILILPITYKIFNMPYNNYLNYKEE